MMNTFCIFPILGKTSYTELSVTQKPLDCKHPDTIVELCVALEFVGESTNTIWQVSGGSAGDYQADEQAGVAGVSWRL